MNKSRAYSYYIFSPGGVDKSKIKGIVKGVLEEYIPDIQEYRPNYERFVGKSSLQISLRMGPDKKINQMIAGLDMDFEFWNSGNITIEVSMSGGGKLGVVDGYINLKDTIQECATIAAEYFYAEASDSINLFEELREV